MRMKHSKFCLLAIVALVTLVSASVFASSPLQVASGDLTGFIAFDANGKVVTEQQTKNDGIGQGWILSTADVPVILDSPIGVIELQQNSLMGVSQLSYDNPVFYLVAGSAIFNTNTGYTGTLNVATPVSRYELNEAGQMLVCSDIGELIYSFGGEIKALNIITNAKTVIPPFYYLDMMVPMMQPKEISSQTYQTLAYEPSKEIIAKLRGTAPPPSRVSATSTTATPKAPIIATTSIAKEPAKVPAAPASVAANTIITPAVTLVEQSPTTPTAPSSVSGTKNILQPKVPTTPTISQSKATPALETIEEPLIILEKPAIPAVDNKLTVRSQTTTLSGNAKEQARIDGGVALYFGVRYDGGQIATNVVPLTIYAIKPYFHYNSFKLGLQATLTVSDSYKWEDVGGTVKFNTSSPLDIASSILSFIDYFKFGTPAGKVYFNVTTDSMIKFGQNTMMGGINQRYNNKYALGFYNQVNTSWYGHQIYFDDLYLQNLLEGKIQTGGIRFSFTPSQSYPFAIGISSLAVLNNLPSGFVLDLYPSLDLIFPLVNNRKLQMNLAVAGAMYLQALPQFDIKQIYNSEANSIADRIPNALASLQLDASFFGAKLGLGVAYNHGKTVSNLVNSTQFSGQQMTNKDTIDLMLNGSYSNKGFAIAGAWNIPFALTGGFAIANLAADSSRKADIASFELGYSGSKWGLGAGIQQIDMIGAYTALFTSSANITTKFEKFLDPMFTRLYAYANYDTGAVRLDVRLGTTSSMGFTNFNVAPVLDLGMTMRWGTGTFEQFGEAPILQEKDKVKVTGSLSSTFVANRFSPSSSNTKGDYYYLFIKPMLDISSKNFAMGLGLNFGMNLSYHTFFDQESWYAPRGNRFWDFGFIDAQNKTTLQKALDLTSDIFNLVEYMRINNPTDAFYLTMDRQSKWSFAEGTLVNNMMPNLEAPYFTALPLRNILDTKHFGYELFVDDLTFATLLGLGFSSEPLVDMYPFSVGISAVAQTMRYSYDMMVYPGLDFGLPCIYGKESSSLEVGIHAFTAAHLSSASNKFLLLDENGKLKNYLLGMSFEGMFNGFGFNLAAGVQSGWLSYGMFNEFYIRENTAFVGDATADMSYYAALDLNYQHELFDIGAGYMMNFSAPGFSAFNYLGDKVNLNFSVDTSYVDVSFGFVKKDIVSSTQAIITANGGALQGFKDFFLNKDTIAFAQMDIKAGLATITGKLATTATYDNHGTAAITLRPSLSMGMKISI